MLLAILLAMTIDTTASASVARVDSVREEPGRSELYVVTGRREGVTQDAYVLRPAAPDATVLLFMGGDANVSPDGVRSGNFLVRSRELFFDENLMVAVVGLPSDRRSLHRFRHSEAHALDIQGLIAELRGLADVPVWAVGTSNGSASAVNAALRLAPMNGPDGIVLTASVETSGKGRGTADHDPPADP